MESFSPSLMTDGGADERIYFECPACHGLCEVKVSDINCRIFRHLAHPNGTFVSPHMPKHECVRLIQHGAVGCGAAIQLDNNRVPRLCSYDL